MNIHRTPNTHEKIAQTGLNAALESAGDTPTRERRGQSRSLAECISSVTTPTGAKPVLKTMITTACERNCNYCPFRAGHSKTRRVTITPDALARAFDELQRAGQVDGLFLSSGIIKGGASSQDKIIDTADILRRKFHYRGYIHLKIMPGTEEDQLLRSMQLADRVSINLEGPTPTRLNALAPKKDLHNELLLQIQRAHALREQHPRLRAGLVTQFVVGAVGDTDVELLSLTERLYNQFGLKRTYYSAFHPVDGTPFETRPATPKIRQNRLYQASFLLRDYGWDVEDLPFIDGGNLRTDVDPKRAFAEAHLRHAPVDLAQADRDTLLRLPGIGPLTADKILHARRERALRDLGQLARLGVRDAANLAPYVLLGGRRPPQQPGLWAAD